MPTDAPDIFPYIWIDQAAYAIADLRPPWAVRVEATRRHWIYRVRRGSCTFEPLRRAPRATRLERNDIVGITNELPHAFRDPLNTSIPKNPRVFEFRPPGAPESDDATSILVGSVPFAVEPLISLFPSVFCVKADGSIHSQRLLRILGLAELEIDAERHASGSPSVLRRLSRVLVAELLRFATERMSGGDVPTGSPASPTRSSLASPLICTRRRAIAGQWRRCAALPDSADQRSRIGSVRCSAGLRSATTSNFAMGRAATAIAGGRQMIGEVASSIGCESEGAFNRAFHRAGVNAYTVATG